MTTITKGNVDKYLKLLQALKDRRPIQRRNPVNGRWEDAAVLNPYYIADYRIKPKPKEFWVNEYRTNNKTHYGKYGKMHETKEGALEYAKVESYIRAIHLIEVED